jgi:hypothetical protein
MLFSEGNAEDTFAPAGWRALLEARGLSEFVSSRLTNFGRSDAARRPPTLLVRTLAVTLATVLTILLLVFVVLVLDLRARVHGEVADGLETSRLLLSSVDDRRSSDLAARLVRLASNPTFDAGVRKFANTYGGFTPLEIRQSMAWLEGELRVVADAVDADVAAMVDPRGLTMAQAGRRSGEWPVRPGLPWPGDDEPVRSALLAASGRYYSIEARPVRIGSERVATLCVGRRLDASGAAAISTLTRAETVLLAGGAVVGSTLDAATAASLGAAWRGGVPDSGEVKAAGEWYAFRRLPLDGGAQVFALAPMGRPASRTTAKAFRALVVVALGALVLALVGSFWLARNLADPIDGMSRALSAAVAARDFGVRLEAGGGSRELEDLTRTFNELMAGLSKAEAESQQASLDAIQALAKAMEARDVYTAGHAERVGDLAVRLGAEMGLSAFELETLRVGASLHDIGKIGVADRILRKAGPLTAEERRAIEQHPLVGARILQPVSFLAEHLRIVELHHERPDGRGYPHGLTRDRIPLAASIVRLADAYDAMTSDRPYRPGRPAAEALAEIVRGRSVEFDEAVVDALVRLFTSPCRTPAAGSAASCR